MGRVGGGSVAERCPSGGAPHKVPEKRAAWGWLASRSAASRSIASRGDEMHDFMRWNRVRIDLRSTGRVRWARWVRLQPPAHAGDVVTRVCRMSFRQSLAYGSGPRLGAVVAEVRAPRGAVGGAEEAAAGALARPPCGGLPGVARGPVVGAGWFLAVKRRGGGELSGMF